MKDLVFQLRKLLLIKGESSARQMMSLLGLSQPTVSRTIRALQDEILVAGSGRSTLYSLKREIRSLGFEFPVFIVDESGQAEHVADLVSIQPRNWMVKSKIKEINSKTYSDLPYWLDDIRAAGFIGRLIPQRFPELFFPKDIQRWVTDDHIQYLVTSAWDTIGNIIIGERPFELYTQNKHKQSPGIPLIKRGQEYQKLADELVLLGEPGSSAGGEQPKFLTTKANTPVLVKFSPKDISPTAQRRKELLIAEHLCLEVLRESGFDAAKSEIIEVGEQIFLELERFDRVGAFGRKGIISLNAIDLEFAGVIDSWRKVAIALLQKKKLTKEDFKEILLRYYFGLCTANGDMHAGNISFYSHGEKLLGLAPVYDMLPMDYSPIYEQARPFIFSPPNLLPNEKEFWIEVVPIAIKFWKKLITHKKISAEFKVVAKSWLDFLVQVTNRN